MQYITVECDHLWLPVARDREEVTVHFYCDGEKFREIHLKLTDGKEDHWFATDVSKFKGKQICLQGDFDPALFAKILQRNEKPERDYPYRPVIHFTATAGWINDPNGLVFAKGVYHLYHQWNPYGTEWGNMHWSHAVSRDMISWEEQGMALEPDEFGTAFSGCGWEDEKNAAGFGADALLFFYTAAGDDAQCLWSKEQGHLCTQRLAVSTDGGKTLQKEGLILDHVKGSNRDPKVLWHEESGAYIMVLFLDETEFAVYRSDDLRSWEEASRFSYPPMWECPDLFMPETEDGAKKWVFWSADGYYRIGDFDGYRFTPQTEVLKAYDTELPYAAQTYAGLQGRVVSVSWLRTKNDRGGFRGMMAVPVQLSIGRTKEGERIRFAPVKELWDRFSLKAEHSPNQEGTFVLPLAGAPAVLEVEWTGCEALMQVGSAKIRFSQTEGSTVLIIDHGIVEYYGNGGFAYGALETDETVLSEECRILAGAAVVREYRMDS
ncbi:MAG: glycoside hydrolase family 32 protein [Lachnospiraceae bacterium]|nr:glycoside hydrolase family 32 protein [Lachnospiraceae bacterium]